MKLGAATVGSIVLAGCRGEPVMKMTATPAAIATARPVPTLPLGAFGDTILVNGNIITMDRADSITQAVAVKDGLILRNGANGAIRALAGANTKTIDLRGKTVTPGLIDAHNHLQVWGKLLSDYTPLVPPDVKTLDDLLAKLKQAIAKAKPGEWVRGYFWDLDPPTRAQLDPVSSNNPVWLEQQGGHFAAVNSAALKIANITAQTRNPEGGVIERDKQGNPTGVLYNHRAMDLCARTFRNKLPSKSRTV
jgi:predicted amidohydrolase YtcJ